jgi:hypothetical protein
MHHSPACVYTSLNAMFATMGRRKAVTSDKTRDGWEGVHAQHADVCLMKSIPPVKCPLDEPHLDRSQCESSPKDRRCRKYSPDTT